MISLLSGTTVVISSLICPPLNMEQDRYVTKTPLVLIEYKSPTMNHDPMRDYDSEMIQEIMDKVLIESIQQ